jgi:hypothetical protein
MDNEQDLIGQLFAKVGGVQVLPSPDVWAVAVPEKAAEPEPIPAPVAVPAYEPLPLFPELAEVEPVPVVTWLDLVKKVRSLFNRNTDWVELIKQEGRFCTIKYRLAQQPDPDVMGAFGISPHIPAFDEAIQQLQNARRQLIIPGHSQDWQQAVAECAWTVEQVALRFNPTAEERAFVHKWLKGIVKYWRGINDGARSWPVVRR